MSRGGVWVRVWPLRSGQTLLVPVAAARVTRKTTGKGVITRVDVSMIAPGHMLDEFKLSILRDVEMVFSGAEVEFVTVEDSGHDSRIYVLLVGRDGTLRWGFDVLTSAPKMKKENTKKHKKEQRQHQQQQARIEKIVTAISRTLCTGLAKEVAGGAVDEHLQDQLVCFQALAAGTTTVFRRQDDNGNDEDEDEDEEEEEKRLAEALAGLELGMRLRADKVDDGPVGNGSMHTRTARWIAATMLPAVRFYRTGGICVGAGVSFPVEEGA